jgi:hypothetical protein
MSYFVEWKPAAHDRLERMWMTAEDPRLILRAANAIDDILARDPLLETLPQRPATATEIDSGDAAVAAATDRMGRQLPPVDLPKLFAGSVCFECKARGTACLLIKGTPCLGPVTQAVASPVAVAVKQIPRSSSRERSHGRHHP